MTSWLHRQRKQTILDLSREAGLKPEEDTRKDELIDALDKQLSENASSLSSKPSFEQYYATRRTPAAPRSTSANPVTGDGAEVKSVVKARGRRVTQVKQETDDEEVGATSPLQSLTSQISAAAGALTPAPVRRRSELLPASPADVAEDMEIAATRFTTNVGNVYAQSGVPDGFEAIRQLCSSVVGVQATILAVEVVSLLRHTLPLKYAFDIPATHLGRVTIPSLAVKVPDFFMLLTGYFWSTTLLWATTHLLLPLIAAYFYNLSTKDVKRNGSRVTMWRHAYDPLIFSVAKALLVYVVYGQGARAFGLIDTQTAYNVDFAMVGAHSGVLFGCGIGALVSLYEAAQRK